MLILVSLMLQMGAGGKCQANDNEACDNSDLAENRAPA